MVYTAIYPYLGNVGFPDGLSTLSISAKIVFAPGAPEGCGRGGGGSRPPERSRALWSLRSTGAPGSEVLPGTPEHSRARGRTGATTPPSTALRSAGGKTHFADDARLEPPQQSKLHSQPPANIAAFDAAGAADHSAKKTTGSVTSRAKTATASGADATPAQAPTQPTTEPQAPTDDPRVEKPGKPKPRTRREPATKKPRPQVPTGQARPENAAIIADPPVDAAGSSAPSTSERRIGLRSGRTAATATTAVDQTDAARQTQEFKKRAGPPLIKASSKKAKGKKQAPPSPSPPSEPLQPESEERSENDDGFHSPDDA